MINKTGRNDPCPCGSGKKYKHCCQTKKDSLSADYLWHKLRDIHDKLVSELMEYVKNIYDENVMLDARDEFLLNEDDELDLDPIHNQAFYPWFLYSWFPDVEGFKEGVDSELHGDLTIAESYLVIHEEELSNLEVRFIRATVDQPYSFYEILDCEQGKGYTLKDIFLGNEVYVTEKSGSQNAQKGDILFVRVIQIDHVGMIVGSGGVLFPPGYKTHIIELRVDIRSETDPITLQDLFKWDEEIRELYLYLYIKLSTPPQLVNTDGEQLCFHELYFDINSPQTAFNRLKNLAVIMNEEELLSEAQFDKNGHVQKIEFSWLKKGNLRMKSWENTVLGHIKIEDKRLTVNVNSKKRAEKIKKKILSLLKDRVKYRTTKVQSVQSMMNKAERDPIQSEQRKQEFLESQSEYQEILDTTLSAHWGQWIHDKIPALGNETPIEAVKDPDGREMVVALLDQFERDNKKQPPEMKQQKYIDRVRQKLGLC